MLLRPPHRKRFVASPRQEKETCESVFFQLEQIRLEETVGYLVLSPPTTSPAHTAALR